jgi:hypothetical protein
MVAVLAASSGAQASAGGLKARPEAAVVAGVAVRGIQTTNYTSEAREGPYIDAAGGIAPLPWLSVSAFGAVTTVPASWAEGAWRYTFRTTTYDVGARLRVRFHGAFFGLGAGYEWFSFRTKGAAERCALRCRALPSTRT